MPVGPAELALLFGLALLVFGPKKLPELGKSLGEGIGNFKRSLHSAQDEFKTAVKSDPKSDDGDARSSQPAKITVSETAEGSCSGGGEKLTG